MVVANLSARQALDLYFLETRAKILDLAALLDRFQRGEGFEQLAADPRWQQIQQALQLLCCATNHKAEQVQLIFSQPYEPDWPRPQPRFQS
jgi:hypothetical protein